MMYYNRDITRVARIFKAAVDEEQDQDKLVDLFRNRVELKKEFAALRDEKYQLQDRVKQHQGATARVQQKMDHLESLLLDREWVHNVVAFYQLRRLSAHCNAKLARFAEQLKQQREKRIHDQMTESFEAQRDQCVRSKQADIGEHRLAIQRLEDKLQPLLHRRAMMNGIAKLIGGGKLSNEIAEIESELEASQGLENSMLAELDEIQKRSPPDQKGFDVATKRFINFMILSLAQQLYLTFLEGNLVELAKEASEKSVGAVNYGSKMECDDIIARIEYRWDSLETVTDHAEELKKRAQLIAEQAMFRNDEDVVPSPGTVAIVYSIDKNGVVKTYDVNLLGDNYFRITKVLSR